MQEKYDRLTIRGKTHFQWILNVLFNFSLTINSLHPVKKETCGQIRKQTCTFSVFGALEPVDSKLGLLMSGFHEDQQRWSSRACIHSSWFNPSTSHREPSRSTPKYTRLIEQSTPRADRPISPHCTFATKYRGASLTEKRIVRKNSGAK